MYPRGLSNGTFPRPLRLGFMHTIKSSKTLDETTCLMRLWISSEPLLFAIAWIAGVVVAAYSTSAQDFPPYLSVQSPTETYSLASPYSQTAIEQTATESPQNALTGNLEDLEFEIPDSIPTSKLRRIDGAPAESDPMHSTRTDARYRVYRSSETITGFMPGDGEQFGWLDFTSMPYLASSQSSGLTTAMGLHLLSGPTSVPLPPRLWDFALGYQTRNTLGDTFSYDLASSIGVYSDFEDSAREGVRPLGHAVGSLHRHETLDWIFGVDYVNRDDYKILPVMGFSWHHPLGEAWRFDLVYPRPRIQYALSDTKRLYLSGSLGGGTWDIEMPKQIDDVMTYRDYRLLFGHEQLTPGGNIAATEIGLVFNRHLQMRHSLQQVDFDDAFVFRMVARR